MPGRPKKPTAVKKAQGTAQKCRELDNEFVPTLVDGVPDPPEVLQKNQRAMRLWMESVVELESKKMLYRVDLNILASYCLELSTYFEMTAYCERNGYVCEGRRRAEDLIRRDCLDRAIKLAHEYGFTPAARTKISMPQQPEKDDYFD